MNAALILRVLLSHWKRRPFQLAALILGLAAATALWTGVQAINAEAKASYAQSARLLGGTSLRTLVPAGGSRFDQALWADLRRLGWPVSPVLEDTMRIDGESFRVIGIEPLSLPRDAAPGDSAEALGDLAGFLTPPFVALAAPDTAARLDGLGGLPPLRQAELPENTILTDIGVAQTLLRAQGKLSRLILAPDFTLPEGTTAAQASGGALRLVPPQETGDLEQLTESLHLNLSAFGYLSFFVGLFIVHAQTGLAFEQRKPTFRTLRACGVSARRLAFVLMAELVVLALIAGILGTGIGYALASVLLPDVSASLHGLYGASVPGQLTLPLLWWLAGVAISVLGALAASGSSLLHVIRLPLLDTARPRAWLMSHERTIHLQLLCAVALLLAAATLLTVGSGLIAGFALLGALLLGAALALPGLLAAALAFGERHASSPVAQWFWADTRQQLAGLSLALMALFLALAVNIGVGTMVGSFRQTFLGWLDQRLTAELYVRATSDEQGARLATWLEPRVDTLLPIWNAEIRLGGLPVRVYGYRDDPSYRQNWPMLDALPDPWDLTAGGNAILLSEQLARRLDLKPGAALDIPTATGDWSVTVAGIYSDYGNPEGQALVVQDNLLTHWQDVEKRRFGARVDADKVAALMAQLQEEFGLDPSQMTDQADLKALSRSVFERTFAVTAALSTLTLGVAGVALLSSLLTLGAMRLPQLAPVWALGIPRRKLVRIEFLRTLMLAILTTLAAVPVGLVVAWVLSNVINVEAFGWQIPVLLFPADWLQLAALALITASLAAIVPIWRLICTPPARLLQVFSHER